MHLCINIRNMWLKNGATTEKTGPGTPHISKSGAVYSYKTFTHWERRFRFDDCRIRCLCRVKLVRAVFLRSSQTREFTPGRFNILYTIKRTARRPPTISRAHAMTIIIIIIEKHNNKKRVIKRSIIRVCVETIKTEKLSWRGTRTSVYNGRDESLCACSIARRRRGEAVTWVGGGIAVFVRYAHTRERYSVRA